MLYRKKMLACLLAISFSLFAALAVQAAEVGKDAKDAKPAEKPPIVIEADELYFSDLTGAMFAKGNVVITQDKAKLLGEVIRGNAKQNNVWIDDKATFLDPASNLVGSQLNYNYGTRSGNLIKGSGKIGRELVKGQNIEILPDEYIIHDGTMTGCPAQIPDYHVSATKVEIWPGDKLIAYNAKFWIKNTLIYSMAKYQKSLRNDGQSEFPQIGYTNRDGISIRQHLEYPVDNKVSVFAEPAYYSKRGFMPNYGVTDQERHYTLNLVSGNYWDSTNSVWVKKEPELNVTHTHQLGSLPIDYTFTGLYGKWSEATRTSWRQDYQLQFTRRPIPLNSTMKLYLGTGFQHYKENLNDVLSNSFNYWVEVSKTWSPKFYTWVEYSQSQSNVSNFTYGSTAVARAFYSGFTYNIDKMNTVAYVGTYDLANHYYYDQDYFWYRDIHCWTMTVEYRAKRKEIIVDFVTKKF